MNPFLTVIAKKRTATGGGGGSGIFYRTMVIRHSKVPSAQTDFPVLVNVTHATLKTVANGGTVQRSDGFDIGFYSDFGLTTKLKWEMESYNPATGAVVAHVKIPVVSSLVDTEFYMGYGDTAITTDQSDPVNVWTNNFVAVYHLGNGTTLSGADSLGANNGTLVNTPTAAAGQIDGCGSFAAASNQYVNLGTGIQPAAITQSAWIKATSYPGGINSVIVRNDSVYITGLWINSGKLSPYYSTSTIPVGSSGSHTLSTGTWYHVVVTYDNVSGMANYVNAASDYTAAAAGFLQPHATTVYIARDPINTFQWDGQIDEVRVASVARSADWVTAEYNNQSDPGTFVIMGSAVEI